MKVDEILRIIIGVLCFLVPIIRVIQFFQNIGASIVFYNFWVDWEQAVSFIEALLITILAIIPTIIGTIITVAVYINFGIMLIVGRKVRVIAIGANIAAVLSILLSIRALVIYVFTSSIPIGLILTLIIYSAIFIMSIITYFNLQKDEEREPVLQEEKNDTPVQRKQESDTSI